LFVLGFLPVADDSGKTMCVCVSIITKRHVY
jgi:hypothetical protein